MIEERQRCEKLSRRYYKEQRWRDDGEERSRYGLDDRGEVEGLYSLELEISQDRR